MFNARSFGGERGTDSEFLCACVLMHLLLLLKQLGKGLKKGKNYATVSGLSFLVSSAISNSLLLVLKEGVFLPSLSCSWLCCLGLLPCTGSGT